MSDSAEDTEITLSTGKMLLIFFGLVVVCAVFFSAGYSLGKTSAKTPVVTSDPTLGAANAGAPKPSGDATPAPADLSFYKAVESKEPDPQAKAPDEPAPGPVVETAAVKSPAPQVALAKTPAGEPVAAATPASGGYFVQVAAVTKQEDADALVGALKKKQYVAFAANNSLTDKLYHVQVGPFGGVKDAEAVKAQLVKDGYTPILKR
jgi:cell division protein FtsN